MALLVTTRNGKEFWRCGIQFGNVAVEVGDDQLKAGAGKSYPPKTTIGDVLRDEPMLICQEKAAARDSGKGGGK